MPLAAFILIVSLFFYIPDMSSLLNVYEAAHAGGSL
jgi:hypothetical protein